RPVALGMAVTSVDRLANGARHRETGDRYCLASTRLQVVLDMEESAPHRRPSVTADVHILIRTMAQDNPLWGAPRIHGELLKLGVDVSQATVAKYVGRRDSKPPSQTWRDVPREPSPATRGRRFLRRPDGHVPTVVRPRDPRARAAPGRAR